MYKLILCMMYCIIIHCTDCCARKPHLCQTALSNYDTLNRWVMICNDIISTMLFKVLSVTPFIVCVLFLLNFFSSLAKITCIPYWQPDNLISSKAWYTFLTSFSHIYIYIYSYLNNRIYKGNVVVTYNCVIFVQWLCLWLL